MGLQEVRKKPQEKNCVVSRRNGRTDELQHQIERILARMRLAVVYGGDKSREGAVIEPTTNPRSWKSYETVARDISASMRRAGVRDIALFADDMHLGENLREFDTHLAWLNTGGVQGHCSLAHAPAMMELFGIPYVGHDPMMAGILDSKHIFKRQLRAAGIETARFAIVLPEAGVFEPESDPVFERAFGSYAGPFVVKPVSGRASLNVHYCATLDDAVAAVEDVYQVTRNYVLVEQYLSGAEYCVAIGGPIISRGGKLERLLDKDEKIFTSMDLKPISGDRARLLDPVAEAGIRNDLTEIALTVWRQMGVETLVRLDIRADHKGVLHVLEANPKPDLKAPVGNVTSLVSIGLGEFGMTYDDLIMSIFADRVDQLLSEVRGSASRLARIA